MTDFDTLTTALADRLRTSIAATPSGEDPSQSLYAFLAYLNQSQGGGGGGSGGGSGGGLTQAQTKAAIESATNIDEVESLLNKLIDGLTIVDDDGIFRSATLRSIANYLDSLSATQNAIALKTIWISRTLNSSSAEYSQVPGSGGATNLTFTVPNGKRWQFVSAYMPLTTNATAGNRLVRFGAGVGASWLQMLPFKATQPASTTRL